MEKVSEIVSKVVGFLQKHWLNLFIFFGGVCIIYGGLQVCLTLLDYKTGQSTYAEAEDLYVIDIAAIEEKESTEDILDFAEPIVKEREWYEQVDVDLTSLQKENADVKGWIYFENETISYPVLQGKDNDTYIRTTYNGKSATAGSIFMDSANSADFSDNHTIIYGHNMKDLTMFGKLKYYKTEADYYNTHQYFQIITTTKKLRYQIFVYKEIEDDSDLYTIYKGNDPDFFKFARDVISTANQCPGGVIVGYDDHVITLSTCTVRDDMRFVVCGILVDTYMQ